MIFDISQMGDMALDAHNALWLTRILYTIYYSNVNMPAAKSAKFGGEHV